MLRYSIDTGTGGRRENAGRFLLQYTQDVCALFLADIIRSVPVSVQVLSIES